MIYIISKDLGCITSIIARYENILDIPSYANTFPMMYRSIVNRNGMVSSNTGTHLNYIIIDDKFKTTSESYNNTLQEFKKYLRKQTIKNIL